MKSKKFTDERTGTSLIEKPKTETSNQAAVKIPDESPRPLSSPFRLELAGNRLSPLHEW
jgi:hypothetical protein